MATIKQASNERLRRIERDCRGVLMAPDVTPYHAYNSLSFVRHENQRRGDEV